MVVLAVRLCQRARCAGQRMAVAVPGRDLLGTAWLRLARKYRGRPDGRRSGSTPFPDAQGIATRGCAMQGSAWRGTAGLGKKKSVGARRAPTDTTREVGLMSVAKYDVPAPIVRAVAGAEFLDVHQPDWLDIVDEQHLDVAGVDECPLGQLGRHLDPDHSDPGECCWVAVDKYGLDTEAMLRLGFAGEVDEIESLNAAWTGVIYARRRLAKAALRAGDDDVEIVQTELVVA